MSDCIGIALLAGGAWALWRIWPKDTRSADASVPLVERLSYRVGFLKGNGFPGFARDIRLHEEATDEILRLQALNSEMRASNGRVNAGVEV